MEDIVGREAIRQAFVDFVGTFHTVSWQPSYQVVEVLGDRAFLLGRFVERREVRGSGDVERVPGRLVLVCRREADGAWRITHAMTSRYGEETIEAGA
jgi:ketosteroid isomerase-like protein